jgi:hypothetical protein
MLTRSETTASFGGQHAVSLRSLCRFVRAVRGDRNGVAHGGARSVKALGHTGVKGRGVWS